MKKALTFSVAIFLTTASAGLAVDGDDNFDNLLQSYEAYEQSQGLIPGSSDLSNNLGAVDTQVGEYYDVIRETSSNSGALDFISQQGGAEIPVDVQNSLTEQFGLTGNELSSVGAAVASGSANALQATQNLASSASEGTKALLQENFGGIIAAGQTQFNGVQQTIGQAANFVGDAKDQAIGVATDQVAAATGYLEGSVDQIRSNLIAQGITPPADLAQGLAELTGGQGLVQFADGNFSVNTQAITSAATNAATAATTAATTAITGAVSEATSAAAGAISGAVGGVVGGVVGSFLGGNNFAGTSGASTGSKENEATTSPGYTQLANEASGCIGSKCDNLIPLCPAPGIQGQKGSESGNVNITAASKAVCSARRAALMQGFPVGNQESTAMVAPVMNTSSSISGTDEVEFVVEGDAEGSAAPTFGTLFRENANRIATKINNWRDKDNVERDGEAKSSVINKQTGKAHSIHSKLSETELIEAGFVSLIEKKTSGGGKTYSVSLNPEWVPGYRPYDGDDDWQKIRQDSNNTSWKKWILGGGEYTVVPQKIHNVNDLMAPRGGSGWMELYALNTSASCTSDTGDDEKYDDDYGQKYSFSQVCVHGGQTHKALFPEYDNSSGVLATIGRAAKYELIFNPIYYACLAATYGAAESACCIAARATACNAAILPHVDAENDILYDYAAHSSSEQPDTPYATNDAVKAYDNDTLGLGGDFSGFKSNGKTWVWMDPEKRFGFKGPFLKLPTTGTIFTKAQEDAGIDRGDLEPWRLTAIINPFVLPDGSNVQEDGVFDMECKIGGFEALKSHIAKCIDIAGVNGVCDPNIALWQTSGIGRLLYLLSANSVEDGTIGEFTEKEVDGKTVYEDSTPRSTWTFTSPQALGNYWNTTLRQPLNLDDETPWPGTGAFVGGLDSAKAGTLFIDDALSSNYGAQNASSRAQPFVKRPYIAYIKSRKKTPEGIDYLEVTRFNNGTSQSACGYTEMAGLPTNHTIYLSSAAKGPYGELKPCLYGEYHHCYWPEEDKANVKIYNPDLDDRCFDPATGEEC